jgi:hypothetical protein
VLVLKKLAKPNVGSYNSQILEMRDKSLLTTTHISVRMAQRGFTSVMVDAILDAGAWNNRGDQLVMNQRECRELEALLVEKRRQCKRLEQEVRDLERLRRKGRVTVVTKDGHLITVYRNAKQD